jgi:hypothetical protein
VFATTAARDAAITAPAEGQFAFTKDTNGLWYYDGAAWVASGATGDIEGVTAGVGISGGGTSGTVTVTNSMATAIDAKGDLVPGTGADTFARLAVGANGTVLTADSAETTGLKWATPAAGGKVLQVVFASTSTQTTNATTTFADTTLTATITPSATSSKVLVLVSQNGVLATTASTGVKLRLLRGASVISTFSGSLGYTAATSTRTDIAGGVSYLDTPSTTSATTYKTQFAQRTSDATAVQVQVTGGDDTSTMVLLEIGA